MGRLVKYTGDGVDHRHLTSEDFESVEGEEAWDYHWHKGNNFVVEVDDVHYDRVAGQPAMREALPTEVVDEVDDAIDASGNQQQTPQASTDFEDDDDEGDDT